MGSGLFEPRTQAAISEKLLDAEGALKLPHADIARLVHDKFNGGDPSTSSGSARATSRADWWSQMVTVGYERLRGLRAANQRRSGAFEISKSKTIAAPVERVFAVWQSAPKRKRWLADPNIEISTATAPKSIRFRWVDGKSRAHTT